MKDDAKKKPSRVEVHVLRCSACDKTFPAVPASGKGKCPHCGEEYVHDGDGWNNAKWKAGQEAVK